MISCLYVPKDQPIFNKGDIGDAAYLILHGIVEFFNTNTLNWLGAEEDSLLNEKIHSEINQASAVKLALNIKNADGSTYNSMMIESKVNEFE